MKRFFALICSFLLVASLLAGCNPKNTSDTPNDRYEEGWQEGDAAYQEEEATGKTTQKATGWEQNPKPSNNQNTQGGGQKTTTKKTTQKTTPMTTQKSADLFTDRDSKTDYDVAKAITVQLNGNTAKASSNTVQISGSTITLTANATHVISGSLNGSLVIKAADTAKMQLVLNNVRITSPTSAALHVQTADKVFVTLNGKNTLANGGSFVAADDNNIDGAVFSKQDITFNGSGSLTVTSPAGHGIVGKDDLVLTGGTYDITAAAHALDANNSIRVKDSKLTAVAGKDGIHAEHAEDTAKGFVYLTNSTLSVQAEGDGISASAQLQIDSGSFDIVAGGGYENGAQHSSGGWGNMPGRPGRPGRPGEQAQTSSSSADASTSMKGLKATDQLMISKGTFQINAADDAIHSNNSVQISGGSFTIASGDDGVHADQTLTITNGDIHITNSYEGLEALDVTVKGGNIKLVATDDGINAAGGTDQSGSGGRDDMFGGGPFGGNSNGSITISGGNLQINASGDGMDANGNLTITGGKTVVTGPTQGDTSVLDYDKTGQISGGTFIGTGGSNMAQSLQGSGQGVIFLKSRQSANTKLQIVDANGKVLISHTPTLGYDLIVISSPDLKAGQSYTLTVGSSSQKVTAN